jgi:uncharacterized surface protein with fasciclin (FAS1) repeats
MNLSLRHPLAAACLALATLSISGLAHAADDTVVSVAAKNPELSTFSRLVKQAGLDNTLNSGAFTVFAPSDDAFKAVPADKLDALAKDPEQLKAVLTYHVLSGKTVASAVIENSTPATVNGAKLALSRAGDFVTVDDAMVTKADVPAGDSVVHVIDRVLTPPKK